MTYFNVAFKKDNVYQANLVEADTKEVALVTFTARQNQAELLEVLGIDAITDDAAESFIGRGKPVWRNKEKGNAA